MQRREMLLIGAVGLASISFAALAQSERRVRRIGYLSISSAQSNAALIAAFREGMAELRWVEGRDYVIEARYGNGVSEAGPNLAMELVSTQPDLLLTNADEGLRLLSERTKTIPIVFAIASDPLGNGYAASLQRPGGSATGLTNMAPDLTAKRLQLLKEGFPRISRVVLLVDPNDASSRSQATEAEVAVAHLNLRATPIEIRKAADIEPAFKKAAALGAQACMLPDGFVINAYRQVIVDQMMRYRIPAIYPSDQFVEAGGLMSYGPSKQENFRRAAAYVDKILKGAKAGDLPIEQPTKFELVINMKTAKALGLIIPRSIRVRADKVIE